VDPQQYNPEEDFEVRAIDGGTAVEITRYPGSKAKVNIPPKIHDLPVTKIGEEAFKTQKYLSEEDIEGE